MQRLNLELARQLSETTGQVDAIRSAPVRVLQIGTGNFLRAFCGWMFERLNRRGLFHGTLAVVQATPGSRTTRQLREQDGCYTVLQRGLQDGKLKEQQDLVTCVTRVLNPYEEWSQYLALATNADLRFVVSNTTEAGIVYKPVERLAHSCPHTFPAQITALLLHRFKQFASSPEAGLVFLPCELIERNGMQLRDIILRHATDLQLGDAFAAWVHDACVFCNTLVDRIVTGYPKDEADAIQQRLGYTDCLLVASELYHNWIIEGPAELAHELPFAKAGLNVTWTDDVTPYRTRKVRILNGAHTAMVAAAFLAGCDTVLAAMNDDLIAEFVEEALMDEIVPTLEAPPLKLPANIDSLDVVELVMQFEETTKTTIPDEEAEQIRSVTDAIALIRSHRERQHAEESLLFARHVLTRFRNPTIQHRLLSIALNSTSKWKFRVLPSMQAYVAKKGQLPRRLTLSLAALIALYRVKINEAGVGIGSRNGQPYELTDTPEALRLLSEAWKTYDKRSDPLQLSRDVLGQESLWDMDLNKIPGLTQQVASDIETIVTRGMRAAIEQVTSKL